MVARVVRTVSFGLIGPWLAYQAVQSADAAGRAGIRELRFIETPLWHSLPERSVRIGNSASVAFRFAKERNFRGANRDSRFRADLQLVLIKGSRRGRGPRRSANLDSTLPRNTR
jgi:hypothetical protein